MTWRCDVRTFKAFDLAQSEIKRDLHEMGIPQPDDTIELTQYIYRVDDPDYTAVEGVNEEYVAQEWAERLAGDLNPGRAWRHAKHLWEPRHEDHGLVSRFAYTDSDRAGGNYIVHLNKLIEERPESRELYLSVWDRLVDLKRAHHRHVPENLGYHVLVRNGKVHLTYFQRACDFVDFWPNDVVLASMLQHYIATATEHEVGHLTHWVGSLYLQRKDLDTDAF